MKLIVNPKDCCYRKKPFFRASVKRVLNLELVTPEIRIRPFFYCFRAEEIRLIIFAQVVITVNSKESY